jgi:hypothetical protein
MNNAAFTPAMAFIKHQLFNYSFNHLVEFSLLNSKEDWLRNPKLEHPFYNALILDYYAQEQNLYKIETPVAISILRMVDRELPVHFNVLARWNATDEAKIITEEELNPNYNHHSDWSKQLKHDWQEFYIQFS